MRLGRYLERLRDTIYSRREIEVEYLRVEEVLPNRLGAIGGRLRFYDDSLLAFDETVIERGIVLVKTDYAYHYQRADRTRVFRYGNAPHHPEVLTFPDHIHIEGRVEAAEPPELAKVLHRIDELLYPTGQQDSALSNRA